MIKLVNWVLKKGENYPGNLTVFERIRINSENSHIKIQLNFSKK